VDGGRLRARRFIGHGVVAIVARRRTVDSLGYATAVRMVADPDAVHGPA